MGWGMARNREHVERHACEVERLASFEQHLGIPRADGDGRIRGMNAGILEEVPLARCHVHRGARALGEVGDPDEVVEVPVGDEDRDAPRAEGCEPESDLGGVAARIDDDGLGRTDAFAHEVTVRPHGTERESVDDRRHAGFESRRGGTNDLVQIWRHDEVATPGGTRSPVVLYSGDEGRVILVGFEPGQELGDHEVREHALLVPVSGFVDVVTAEQTIRAEPGTLVRLERAERRRFAARAARASCWCLRPGPGRATTRRAS